MFNKSLDICRFVKSHGGLALFVGGYVRDRLLGLDSKDIDIEVFGIEPARLKELLEQNFKNVKFCGESFGAFKVDDEIDVTLPRTERSIGDAHTDFECKFDPFMSLADAAKRRDFTINAIYFDPLENRYSDPYGGITDLQKKRLQHINEQTFVEDPLRVPRGMQFCSRFGLTPESSLLALAHSMRDMFSQLSKERVYGEFEKWAAKGKYPSKGLHFLRASGWVHLFPAFSNMIGCPQPFQHHPEGCVWTHTLHVCDEMKALGGDYIDMLAALFHDIGKPDTTKIIDGKITAHGHDKVGARITLDFFEKYFAGYRLDDLQIICELISLHMYNPIGYKAKTVRKFMRKTLHYSSLDRFERLLKADSFGRPPLPKKMNGNLAEFIKECREYGLVKPLVKGQDLIDLGWKPGPQIGHKLRELESLHIQQGLSREQLLERVGQKG